MGAAWGAALLQLQGPPLAQPQLHPAPQPQAGLAVLQPVLQPLVQPQPPLHPLPQPSVHPLPQPQPSVHPQPLPHLLQGNMRFSTSFKLGRQRGTAQPVEVQPEAQGSAQPPLHPQPGFDEPAAEAEGRPGVERIEVHPWRRLGITLGMTAGGVGLVAGLLATPDPATR